MTNVWAVLPFDWHVYLTVIGAAAELIGLTLVLLDASDARQRARDVVNRNTNIYPASMRSRSKMGVPTVTGGRVPTLEERVARLEADVPRLYRELDDRIDKVDDDAQDAAGQARGQAMGHADDFDRKLRNFIADALGSSRSMVGVGFFAAGVIASAAGNLV